MIEAPRAPARPAIAPPGGRVSTTFRPRARVLKGSLPTELKPREEASPQAPPTQPWLPVIPAGRRRALLELHQAVAEVWTHQLQTDLGWDGRVRLCGLSFASAEQLAAEQVAGANVTLFTIAGSRKGGCLLVSDALITALGRRALDGDEGDSRSLRLTRLETLIALRAMERVVNSVGDCYARAAIGSLNTVGRGEALNESPLFGLQDYLVVFRFAAGEPERGISLTLALNEELTSAVAERSNNTGSATGSTRSRQDVAALPLEARIVLGSWSVPLAELLALAPGDEIILPPGDDAHLEVAGRRLRRLRVEVAGPALVRAHVGPLR